MSFLEDRELTPIELEIKSARDRFDDIVSVLEARGLNLESTLTRLEQYQIAYNDLILWLECAEDIQIKWTPVENDVETILKNFHEYQVNFILGFCILFTGSIPSNANKPLILFVLTNWFI